MILSGRSGQPILAFVAYVSELKRSLLNLSNFYRLASINQVDPLTIENDVEIILALFLKVPHGKYESGCSIFSTRVNILRSLSDSFSTSCVKFKLVKRRYA